jgi:hypothetical protein
MFGMYYISASSTSYGINAEATKYWTETSIVVFLGIVVSLICGKSKENAPKKCTF